MQMWEQGVRSMQGYGFCNWFWASFVTDQTGWPPEGEGGYEAGCQGQMETQKDELEPTKTNDLLHFMLCDMLCLTRYGSSANDRILITALFP